MCAGPGLEVIPTMVKNMQHTELSSDFIRKDSFEGRIFPLRDFWQCLELPVEMFGCYNCRMLLVASVWGCF